MFRKLIVCIGFVMATTAGMTGTAVADPEPRPEQCGFYGEGFDVYYKHCGSNWITIRVRFWYGTGIKDIRVGPGRTNLSTHPELQGSGMITNAWCVQDC